MLMMTVMAGEVTAIMVITITMDIIIHSRK
jgi:hypothetical protein